MLESHYFNKIIRKTIFVQNSCTFENSIFTDQRNSTIIAHCSQYVIRILSSKFCKIHTDNGCVLVDCKKLIVDRSLFDDVILEGSHAAINKIDSSTSSLSLFFCFLSFGLVKGTKSIEAQGGNHLISMLNSSHCDCGYDSAFSIKTDTNSSVGHCSVVSNHALYHAMTTFGGSMNHFFESFLVNNTQDSLYYGTVCSYVDSSRLQCYRISIIENSGSFPLMSGNIKAIQCFLSNRSRVNSQVVINDMLSSPINEFEINPGNVIIWTNTCKKLFSKSIIAISAAIVASDEIKLSFSG